jgi:lipid-A-disaccharide synthase
VSGDLQGALLIEALVQRGLDRGLTLDITALGGPRMAQAGATLIGDTTAIGSVGIFEALPYVLPNIRLQRQAKQYLKTHPPDLVVMIDNMVPHLALGKYLKQVYPQVPVVYYIAPQQWVWAFSSKDTEQLVAQCDRMLAIFKAEVDYYQGLGPPPPGWGIPWSIATQPPPTRPPPANSLGWS